MIRQSCIGKVTRSMNVVFIGQPQAAQTYWTASQVSNTTLWLSHDRLRLCTALRPWA
jgi:hypothetical protein